MRYHFLLDGRPSTTVLGAFPELSVEATSDRTTALVGDLQDYAELRGLLIRFDDFAVTVLEMSRVPD